MTTPASYHGLIFPPEIFICRLSDAGVHDFEKKAPGLGYSASYVIDGIHSYGMTAYIYDMGVANIPADVGSDEVKGEFVRSVREVLGSSAYSGADVTDNGVYTLQKRMEFWIAYLDLTLADSGRRHASMLALTSWGGKFFKLRINQPPSPTAQDEMVAALSEWVTHLSPAAA